MRIDWGLMEKAQYLLKLVECFDRLRNALAIFDFGAARVQIVHIGWTRGPM